jgi:hypothetical protein
VDPPFGRASLLAMLSSWLVRGRLSGEYDDQRAVVPVEHVAQSPQNVTSASSTANPGA